MKKVLPANATMVLADVKTVIFLDKVVELDEEAILKVLAELKVKHKGMERDDSYIL